MNTKHMCTVFSLQHGGLSSYPSQAYPPTLLRAYPPTQSIELCTYATTPTDKRQIVAGLSLVSADAVPYFAR